MEVSILLLYVQSGLSRCHTVNAMNEFFSTQGFPGFACHFPLAHESVIVVVLLVVFWDFGRRCFNQVRYSCLLYGSRSMSHTQSLDFCARFPMLVLPSLLIVCLNWLADLQWPAMAI